MPIATRDEPVTTVGDKLKELAIGLKLETEQAQECDAILRSLSLPEKVFLLSGTSFTATNGVPKHGLYKAQVSDAQTDVRGSTIFNAPTAAVFPNATALASTWDLDTISRVGAALAEEMVAKDVDCLMAPTLNLHRDPRGGRNQESYGEDPFVAGKCGSALVRGIQSQGRQATLKHLVCNDSETSRREYDVQVDERVLREVYLRPFEIAVEESNPSSIMAAYNVVNGQNASANAHVLTDIVRKEWKYEGLIMSDWFGTYDGLGSLQAGLDLEMPFPATRGPKLMAAIQSGQIPESALDTSVKRMIQFLKRAGTKEARRKEESSGTSAECGALIRQVAAESIVLLKNDESILPLDVREIKSIAVIGSLATDRVISHLISPAYMITPLEGIRSVVSSFSSPSECKVAHAHGPQTHRLVPCLDKRFTDKIEVRLWNLGDRTSNDGAKPVHVESRKEAIETFLMRKVPGLMEDFEIEMEATVDIPVAGDYEFGIISASHAKVYVDDVEVYNFVPDGVVDIQRFLFHQHTFEQRSRHHFANAGKYVLRCISQSQKQVGHEPVATGLFFGLVECATKEARIQEAVQLATESDVAVLFVGTTSEWEMEGVDREDLQLPSGQDDLVKAVIAAKGGDKVIVVNQSGAAVDLNCATDAGAIVHAHFGGQEAGNAIADVLFGLTSPSGKTTYTWPRALEDSPSFGNFPHDDKLQLAYAEGLFMGWKGYERERAAKPAYAFGHGLSYTTFAYSDVRVEGAVDDNTKATLQIKVTNTGCREGREVVQVYVSGPGSSKIERPAKSLEGFAKTTDLQPGQSETVAIDLGRRSFAYWCTEQDEWVVEPGSYMLHVAKSSLDIVTSTEFVIETEQRRIENLTRHARNHNATQTWTCPHCSKGFVRSDLYKRHLKIHPPELVDRDSQKRRDSALRSSVGPSKTRSGHLRGGTTASTSDRRSSDTEENSASRIRTASELCSNGDSEHEDNQPLRKKPRNRHEPAPAQRSRKTLEEEDHEYEPRRRYENNSDSRQSPSPFLSTTTNLTFDDDDRFAGKDGRGGPGRTPDRGSSSSAMLRDAERILYGAPGSTLDSLPSFQGLTSLASAAVNAQPPSQLSDPFIPLVHETRDGRAFHLAEPSGLRDDILRDDGFHSDQIRTMGPSRRSDSDVFRADSRQLSTLSLGKDRPLYESSPFRPTVLGPAYTEPAMDTQMQTSGFDLQQTMVWDALGQFGEGDTLQWDQGMHWVLDDATNYFNSLPDLTQQHSFAMFGGPEPTAVPVQSTSFDAPEIRFEDNMADTALLSYFVSEINQLGTNNNVANTTTGETNHQDPYALGHARAMTSTDPAPGAFHRPESASLTRASSPRGGLFSRAGSIPHEETAEDRWPMNWKPAGRAFTLNASKYIDEVIQETDIEPSLHKWSRYWIDERMRKTITNSFGLAKAMPGPDVSHFVMPESIHTLNHFISLYFEHFHEQLPVLHLPTFGPSSSPPLLLAAIICVGACYSDRAGARTFAVEMIEVLRKTLNALFEHDSTNLRSASLIHVYLLVMLSGLLIGNKRTYELAEASRGTLINLCRRADLLGAITSTETKQKADGVEERWKMWATLESRKRLGVAICLVDVIFPAVLDIPAYHSHGEMLKTALPCDEVYFAAATAKAWTNLLGSSSSPPCPFFTMALAALLTPIYVNEPDKILPIPCLNPFAALVTVSALHHHIYEFRSQLSTYTGAGLPVPLYRPGSQERLRDGFEGRKQWLKESLETWRTHYYDSHPDSLLMNNARALYHLGHVSLSVYVHSLYLATGKRGKQAAMDVSNELQHWAPSEDACHAVKHSLGLLDCLSRSKRTSPYYPLCVFVATLSMWAFVRHMPIEGRGEEQLVQLAAIQRWLAPIAPAVDQQDRYTRKGILQKGAKLLAETKAWRIGSAFALVLVKEAEMDPAA